MGKIDPVCPKCDGHNVERNSQANPVQEYHSGKDLKVDKYPEYYCKDCREEFGI